MNKSQKLQHCIGCYNNFYNGNNNLDVKECWNLKQAKLVSKKKVHINQVPPWTQPPVKVLNCYRESGYVFVEPKATC